MAAKKKILACTECGQRNYSSPASTTNTSSERLELKKFCKHCNKHTLHKETK